MNKDSRKLKEIANYFTYFEDQRLYREALVNWTASKAWNTIAKPKRSSNACSKDQTTDHSKDPW